MSERENEKVIDLLFHLFMHSSVDFCMCLKEGLQLQILYPTELPGLVEGVVSVAA